MRRFHHLLTGDADATDKGRAQNIGVGQVAQALTSIGEANAHGLAAIVSNYYTTAESITYANELNGHLATAKPFVIDTRSLETDRARVGRPAGSGTVS